MAASVNPVSDNTGSVNASVLSTAIGLARDVYKINMDDQARAAEQLVKDAENKEKLARDTQEKNIQFDKDFSEVKINTPGSVPIKRPGSEIALWYKPRTDLRSEADVGVRQAELNDKRKTEELAKVAKYKTDFDNDKGVRDNTEKVSAAAFINDLIDQKSPILDQVALRQVFRLSGDVGTIRENDLRDLGSSPELKERALAALDKLKDGQVIRPDAREDIRKMAIAVATLAKRDVNRIAGRYADRASGEVRGLNKSDILSQLNPDTVLPEINFKKPENQQMMGGDGTAYGAEAAKIRTSVGDFSPEDIQRELQRRGLGTVTGK